LMKRLLHLLLLVLLLAASGLLAACQSATVTDSGEMTSWEFDFADFTRLDISHSFVVDIQPADEFRISVQVDRAVFEYLVVEKRGDTLHIGLENGNTYINTTQRATITLPSLKQVTLSGASQATIGVFAGAPSLELDLSGASQAELATDNLQQATFDLSGASRVNGSLGAAVFKLKMSGASSVNLDGNAPDLDVNASAGSTVDLKDLPATTARINLSGASTAFVDVSDRIDATLSGASVVTYLGSPKMGNLDISGGSTIRAAN
jgi:hypothetical protein